jgi:hypothetical protein
LNSIFDERNQRASEGVISTSHNIPGFGMVHSYAGLANTRVERATAITPARSATFDVALFFF